jgi:hypothetical protein
MEGQLTVLIGIVIFYLGFMSGFAIEWWLKSKKAYHGTMVVQKDAGKTVYSLELATDPEQLEFEDEVIFKVERSSLES